MDCINLPVRILIQISTSSSYLCFFSPHISSGNWQFCLSERNFRTLHCRDHKKRGGGACLILNKIKKLKPAADKVKKCKSWHMSRKLSVRKGGECNSGKVSGHGWSRSYWCGFGSDTTITLPPPHNLLSISRIPAY
jgi:hypothetical protein